MRDILNCMTVFSQLPQMQNSNMSSSSFRDSSETQTEIVAVHTPQIEHPKEFPFIQKMQRPSSLPICSSNDSSASTKSNTGTATDENVPANVCNGDQDASFDASSGVKVTSEANE
jgi:hypothetical protein